MPLSVNKLISYFDLGSELRPLQDQRAKAASEDQVKIHGLSQYVALLLGIVVQPFLQQYMATGNWFLEGLWGWLIASVFLAIMAFPAVYRRSFDPMKPIIVQLCIIFTAGTGWQTLVGPALTAAGATIK